MVHIDVKCPPRRLPRTTCWQPAVDPACAHAQVGLDPPMRLIPSILIALCVCLVHPLVAGDGKQKHTFSFHSEGNAVDGAKRTFTHSIDGEPKVFQTVPDITQMDFAGFVPFRASDGSYAAAFTLTRHGAVKLNQLTLAKRGAYMVATVDMKVVDYMLIDKPVNDGVLVLWRGLTAEHVLFIEKKLKIPVIKEKDSGAVPAKN